MNPKRRTNPTPGRGTASRSWSALLLTAVAASATVPGVLRAAVSPEEETRIISGYLKPISDDEWKLIAGERISQEYEVVKGDTLYDISQRMFGDAKYWPKIWALNNGKITNPHVIVPGQKVAFLPGSGSSLPGLDMGGTRTQPIVPHDTVTPPATKQAGATPVGRSTEWKNLPRQEWEHVSITLPAEVDPQGFDRRSKIKLHTSSGLDLAAFAATEKISYLGEITGSRSAANFLTLGDVVYIKPTDGLQVGETYDITRDPYVLKSRKSDRIGYSYLVLGSVKIIGVRDGLFIGTITDGKEFTSRGAYVIPKVPRVKNLKPIPAPRSVEGVLILDRNISTYTTAQHKQVFIDRGSNDGVSPGMVFRAFQHRDPSDESLITNSDFIIDGDFLVMQVSPSFCTAIAIRSLVPIFENTSVILLTDVTDLKRREGIMERSIEQRKLDDELDQLDRLDPDAGLGDQEQRELKQLEQWQGNPAEEDLPPPPENIPDDPFTPPGGVPMPEGGATDDQLLTPADPVPDLTGPDDPGSMGFDEMEAGPDPSAPQDSTPAPDEPQPDAEGSDAPDMDSPFPDSEIPTEFEDIPTEGN